MATRRTVLEVDVTSDASDAVREFDAVTDSAANMGDRVSKSVTEVEVSSRGLDSAADSADNLASKSSQATGGLGALASGFSLVGAEKYAVGLESAAMATDFFSGVGDIGNLVLQSTAVQTAKNTALKVKDTIVTKGQAVATNAMTVAQRALNLVMRANPIGLVITAITILIGVFIVLYKRNERFREIVNKVMSAARDFIGKVVDKLGDLVGWFRDKVPGAAQRMKSLVVGYIKLVTLPTRLLIQVISNLVGWIRDKVPGAWSAAKDRVVGHVGEPVWDGGGR